MVRQAHHERKLRYARSLLNIMDKEDQGKLPWLYSIEHRCKNAHKQYCCYKLIHKEPPSHTIFGGQKKRLRGN